MSKFLGVLLLGATLLTAALTGSGSGHPLQSMGAGPGCKTYSVASCNNPCPGCAN
jgi:hypothetical protein